MRSSDGRFEYRDNAGKPLPDDTSIEKVDRFAFKCRRDGERDRCSVNIRGRGHDIPQRSWTLSGSIDAPTLSPSINCEGCWHGWIKAGEFFQADGLTKEPRQ